jgi:hypothetical protein
MSSESTRQTTPLQFLKHEPFHVRRPGTQDDSGQRPGKIRIRCPHCSWEPSPHDRWSCLCLYIWNTFETGGVCPGCQRKWMETQCLRCRAWSLHEDWYAKEDWRPS